PPGPVRRLPLLEGPRPPPARDDPRGLRPRDGLRQRRAPRRRPLWPRLRPPARPAPRGRQPPPLPLRPGGPAPGPPHPPTRTRRPAVPAAAALTPADHGEGQKAPLGAAVVAPTPVTRRRKGLYLHAAHGGARVRTGPFSIPPLSVRKVGFKVPPTSLEAGKTAA